MQKIMNQIMEGNFDYEAGSLDFSCTKIEITMSSNQDFEGFFEIYGEEGKLVSGYVLSSDLRVECLTSEYFGSHEQIQYRISSALLNEGDVIKGNFNIISNQGEYYIPFAVTVKFDEIESSVGPIKNLFHFANLAKSNWREALGVYYHPAFPAVFTGNDSQFYDTYRALSSYPGSEQNMEEFLIQINKKNRVEYLIREEILKIEFSYEELTSDVIERELSIFRNGWGYTKLYIECTGDFLFTEKQELSDDDFLGNHCALPVYVDTQMCGCGKNYGQITLFNSYITLNIPVVVHTGHQNGRTLGTIGRKRFFVQLMELYLAFRTKKIVTNTWLKETGKLVDRQLAMDENDITVRLFQVQLLITEERDNEAGWVLSHVESLMDKWPVDDTIRAYYLYLTTLLHRDEIYVNRVAEEVKMIYRKNDSDWRVAWLLLFLSEEYHKSTAGKWILLEKQFNSGCRSPLIYLEAALLLNQNPSILHRAGNFEKQIIWYGVKNQILRPEVTEQILYLAEKHRGYSGVMFRTLVMLYEKKKDGRVLQQICSLLIKGDRNDEKAFKWYSRGVEENLHLTQLYEYYVASLPMDKKHEIHKIILMYFSYRNRLDYEHMAYIYSYLLENRNKLPDLFENNSRAMEDFCIEQIYKGRINRNLAELYHYFLKPEMFTYHTANALSYLIFAHQITVTDDRIRKVYVYQPGNKIPHEYNLNAGKTWVALYGTEYTIVFEDAWGNRFMKSLEYSLEKLMIPGKYIKYLNVYELNNSEYDLYLCENFTQDEESYNDLDRIIRVISSGQATEKRRMELQIELLDRLLRRDCLERLDGILDQIQVREIPAEYIDHYFEYFVNRGKWEKAGECLTEFGPYRFDAKNLNHYLSWKFEATDFEMDRECIYSALYVFLKGKYDINVIQYLCRYLEAPAKCLRDVWRAACRLEQNRTAICERLLSQMLYSGAYVGEKIEIFKDYLSGSCNQTVRLIFLRQCSHDYYVNQSIMDDFIFEEIQRSLMQQETISIVCKLALLKHYSENVEQCDEQQKQLSDQLLEEFMKKHIHLEFFRAFKDNRQVELELSDKTIIEYHAGTRGKVIMHYVITHDDGNSDEYFSEYMRQVYGNVFFKEFILFFGETLQYYITEEECGDNQLTESGTLQKSEIAGKECEGRYHIINDIVISKNLKDYRTMDEMMEELYKKDFLISRLFQTM